MLLVIHSKHVVFFSHLELILAWELISRGSRLLEKLDRPSLCGIDVGTVVVYIRNCVALPVYEDVALLYTASVVQMISKNQLRL